LRWSADEEESSDMVRTFFRCGREAGGGGRAGGTDGALLSEANEESCARESVVETLFWTKSE
jgi:hypothetical protein